MLAIPLRADGVDVRAFFLTVSQMQLEGQGRILRPPQELRVCRPDYYMANKLNTEEVATLAVNALMDSIAAMVKKGKPAKGLLEDEHAIAMAHVVREIDSAYAVDAEHPENKPALAVAIRAVKNGSQMRQVAEKRGILEPQAKGQKAADLFDQYS